MLICLITLQGFPPAIVSAGILLVTTLPAAIIDLSPIVTPFNIVQPVPIKTSSFIMMSLRIELNTSTHLLCYSYHHSFESYSQGSEHLYP